MNTLLENIDKESQIEIEVSVDDKQTSFTTTVVDVMKHGIISPTSKL